MRKTYSTPQPSWIDQTYTHSREDNRLVGAPYDLAGGSSPLTRGKPMRGPHPRPRARLILAHVGKTPCPAWRVRSIAAHPRSRGENVEIPPTVPQAHGSSPLTRGKPCQHRAPVPHAGLIPAHARKTYGRTASAPSSTAHPRSRGENSCESLIVSWVGGSSPLTRGKHSRPPRSQSTARLIPAHAGKTLRQTMEAQLNAAHPRSRGENGSDHVGFHPVGGSSPLTRGKRRL